MIPTDSAPRAIFGDLLWGTNAVRFIFVDEAGTSDARHEKVRVVVGIIAHADQHLVFAEAALAEALAAVPPEFRDGFVFHAEDVMNNPRFRDRWRLTDRVNLVKSVMAIPRRIGLPIAMGMYWADGEPQGADWVAQGPAVFPPEKLSAAQWHHCLAFIQCITKADKWIREHAEHNEIGSVVCEQSPIKKCLSAVLQLVRDRPIVLQDDHLAWRQIDIEQGFNSQDGVSRVSRIRKTIHFVEKEDDPLVGLADACAYGFKRFFGQQDFGNDFCQAILGRLLELKEFQYGPCCGSIFSPMRQS